MASILPGRRTAISAPPERPSSNANPCLLIMTGAEMGRRIELGHDEISIGRSEESTVCVNSDLVSRHHAVVNRVLGHFIVVDLKSTNGTFVNDARIERAELSEGDLLRVGKTVLKYLENDIELGYTQHILNLAAVDSLTHLFNKRHFDEVFVQELGRATQGQHALSLVLFDIDYFKRINDRYGHPVGDTVLEHVAARAKSQTREGDCLCRVGGEEFALILPHTGLAEATEAAERIRAAVGQSPCAASNEPIAVTLSLGVAEFVPGERPDGLYQRADSQLYAAKRGGRDRVSGAPNA